MIIERQRRECSQPMTSRVIIRDVGKARAQLSVGRLQGNRATGIVDYKKIAQGFPAPCASEIDSVEMNEFGISPVADPCRAKQSFWFTRRELREKAIQPSGEFGRRKRSRHT